MSQHRKPLFAANWKMNKRIDETADFTQTLAQQLSDAPFDLGKDYEVVIAAPATHLPALKQAIESKQSLIEASAQNCGETQFGAYTAEISPVTLAQELNCRWTLVGHSERRHIYGEQNDLILKRARAAWAEGLKVIYCIGETLEERKAGKTMEVIQSQLAPLETASEARPETLTLAYEPVWAIGTGETATPEQAEEVHAHIRAWLKKQPDTRVLYGGSVKPDNAQALLAKPNIDGVLVGGASLDPTTFANLILNGLKSHPSKASP